ncbi:MAG: serine/threonine-protein phosphatase [Balneolaceae bacterium]|nr:MAG: serine/threonine-protein phosphatase [Balneolaceae bacterium]
MSLFQNKYFHISIYRDHELEAFYDTDPVNRRKIIYAHLMIHLLPALLALVFFYFILEGKYLIYIGGLILVFYAAVILETATYLYPKSREFYKKYLKWIIIPLMLPLGYFGYWVGSSFGETTITGIEIILGGIFLSMGAFVWAYVGLSHVFSAARELYTRRAEIESEIEFATEVQNRILKDISVEHDGTEAYACSIPAKELGGDYFELTRINNNLFATVGDISGHSFGAGLLMTMAKSALQTHLEYRDDPSEIMQRLNGMLLRQSDRSMYATMIFLKLNLEKRSAVLCNAGHLPVFHYSRKSCTLEKRYHKGIGLGITEMASYKNLKFSADEGDLIILYSDGLIETRDEQMQIRESHYFEDLLLQMIKNHPDSSPKDLTKSIFEKVKSDDFSDSMEDDSTLILIKI